MTKQRCVPTIELSKRHPDHSDEEDRFIAIGYSNRNRLLVVSFTERDNKTRIINCRKAEPIEREIYEES